MTTIQKWHKRLTEGFFIKKAYWRAIYWCGRIITFNRWNPLKKTNNQPIKNNTLLMHQQLGIQSIESQPEPQLLKTKNDISLDKLPADGVIPNVIVSFLDKKSLSNLAQTCKFFSRLVSSPLSYAWLKEKGLTETDMQNLKLFQNKNENLIKKDIPRISKKLSRGLYCYNAKIKFILESDRFAAGSFSLDSPDFSRMFKQSHYWRGVFIPVARHLQKFWSEVEKDFFLGHHYAFFHNQHNKSRFYFHDGLLNSYITETGAKVIKELGHYTIRHIILFNVWVRMISNTKNPHVNEIYENRIKNWDDIFPKIFPQLLEEKTSLEQELLGTNSLLKLSL